VVAPSDGKVLFIDTNLKMPSMIQSRENWSLTSLSLLDAPAEGELGLVDGLGCLVILLALAALAPEKAPVAAFLAAAASAALVGTCIRTTITFWFKQIEPYQPRGQTNAFDHRFGSLG
jgi:hypothetical protein